MDLSQWRGDWPNSVLSATLACKHGVNRSHVIYARIPGALLLELYSRDGLGMMISADFYEGVPLCKPQASLHCHHTIETHT